MSGVQAKAFSSTAPGVAAANLTPPGGQEPNAQRRGERWSRSALRAKVAAFIGLPALLFGACASSSSRTISTSLRSELEDLELSKVSLPHELDEEMRAWLRLRVEDRGDEMLRVRGLVDALLGDKGLGVEYRREPTNTAREVFREGLANCLSFTHLFVGMAREVKLPVYFLEVRDLENYDREGDLVVHSDHIAVGLGPMHSLTIIDFTTSDATSYRRVRAISDLEAVALFYSNRGAEHLRDGENLEARQWLEDAVKIYPESPGPWINLGVARRRSGDDIGAEAAYRQALEIDAGETAAYQNLATLLRMQGKEEEALDLMALTDRSSNRNPYSFLALGDLSMRHGREDEAERFYRRAMRVQRQHAEPVAALGLLEVARGDVKAAQRLLRRATRLDAADPRVVLLRRRLEEAEREDRAGDRQQLQTSL